MSMSAFIYKSYKLSVFLKLIHATWLVEMYNFLSFCLSQGLVTQPCQGKRSCPGDRLSLKTQNLSDLRGETLNYKMVATDDF